MLIKDLKLILKVAEFRSITAAAITLNMQPATASAAIKRVEVALGIELFIRSTRELRLSAAGERYIPECKKALQMLEQAEQAMRDELDIIQGDLRISVSSDLGRNLTLTWLEEFKRQHPKVRLKIQISDNTIDFYRDSLDVALRYGIPNDSNLYGFKICNVPRLLCASPDYIKHYGNPSLPEELHKHKGLFYELNGMQHDIWQLSKGSISEKVKMRGDCISNDGDIVRRLCVSGLGIANKSCLDMADDLLAERVVNIMPDYSPGPTELWLVCPSRQSIVPTVRVLRDLFRLKTHSILTQLIDKQILDKSVLENQAKT
ncbi:MAG: LysR substrate-binding domain-containing protein [Arenicella sp.]